jgi:predicted nucleic acid-binding protein
VTSFLLDTNVVSELERPRPSNNVLTFLRRTPLNDLYLSEIVIAEIRFGIDSTTNPLRREQLASWLRDVIRPMFAGRILPATEDILFRWRWIMEGGRQQGYTFEQSDALLAATAIEHGLTMLTRDVEPFERAGASHLNPWSPQ